MNVILGSLHVVVLQLHGGELEHSLLVTEDIPPTLHHCNLAMFIPGTFVSLHLAPSVVKHIHPSVRLAEMFTLLGNPIPKYLAEFVILILSPIVNA